MNLQSIIQAVASVANVLSVIVLAMGYYFMVKLYREWLRQREETRTAGGRPLVIVAADYDHVPEVNLVVRNFTQAPAKDVSFEFSAPVEDLRGLILSDLPYLKAGLPFLEPGGKVSRYWDSLPDLAQMLREKGLEDGITVTTRYKDLAGESYKTEWTLNPLLFAGSGLENFRGMNDLVGAVEKIPQDATENGDARNRKHDQSCESHR